MICVGKIVGTHGLKGEIRIISDSKYKSKIFVKNQKLYINKQVYIINNYRKHKNYDMVVLDGINDIDDALKLKNLFVYVERKDIDIEIITDDLVGLEVYCDKYIGIVKDVIKNKQDILVIYNDNKKYLVPYVSEFIKKIDIKNKKIFIEVIEGLLDEN